MHKEQDKNGQADFWENTKQRFKNRKKMKKIGEISKINGRITSRLRELKRIPVTHNTDVQKQASMGCREVKTNGN